MTANCIQSISSLDGDYEIIVIDNNSSDGSGDKLEKRHDDITILHNDKNYGFSGGMNRGIEYAIINGFDYTWILNNDVEIHDESILSSLRCSLRNNDFAGVSPTILSGSGDKWFENGKISKLTGITRHASAPDAEIYPVDYLPLCSAYFETSIFKEIGKLDEDYFMYVEDVDFAIRARREGYNFGVIRDCNVRHFVGGSSGGRHSTLSSYYNTRNHILLLRKQSTFFSQLSFLLVLTLVGYEVVDRLMERQLSSIKAVLEGAFHGYLGISGKR